MKRVCVDMSATLIHHGHIRLLKKASTLGNYLIVALSTDKEIEKTKGYKPELNFNQRKEIIESIKYVDEVIESPWKLKNDYLEKHNIDILVHGDDNSNEIPKEKLAIFPRTEGISSSELRKKVIDSLLSINLQDENSTQKLLEGVLKLIKNKFKLD